MTSRNLAGALAVGATLWLSGCGDSATAPVDKSPVMTSADETAAATAEVVALASEVRQLAASQGITALAKPAAVRPALSLLGQALAFDKELSGNRDISCMTCHLSRTATVDSRSVAIGQGGTGVGTARVHPQGRFVHRSAPALFNLHALNTLTWDGRVFVDKNGVVRTPGANLQAHQRAVLECGTASALPMFPVLSRPEMRAETGNELAAITDDKHQRVWKFLMRRLGAIPEYRTMFMNAYPTALSFDSLNFAHAGNAMGCWITSVFSATNTPWDRMLAGDNDAMTETQLLGARAFLGTARCSQCHNGPLFTDRLFHNVATPQVGPGFGNGTDGHDDFGRERQTGNVNNRYQFRTPPLRNVELTGHYGHDGAIVNLRAWVDHYSQSDVKLRAYDVSQLEPLLRSTLQPTTAGILQTRDTRLRTLVIPSETVDQITEFLKALTDPASRDLGRFVPTRVPSGLTIDSGF